MRDEEWRRRSLPWLDAVGRDLKFVARSLRKTPGFTIIAILVIAVGIGVNTAVFSVINTVLLEAADVSRPAIAGDADEHVAARIRPGRECAEVHICVGSRRAFFRRWRHIDFGGAGLNLTGGDHPLQVQGVHVTQNTSRCSARR